MTAIFFPSLTLEKTRVKVCPALSNSLIWGFLSRLPEIISPSGKDRGTSKCHFLATFSLARTQQHP